MKNHKGGKRQFHHISRAWYAASSLRGSDLIDEVTIGFYHPDVGTTGEFSVKWKELGGNIVPKLEVFNDGWHALFEFGDLLKSMAEHDDENISPDEFCKLLVALGIEDATTTRFRTSTPIVQYLRDDLREKFLKNPYPIFSPDNCVAADADQNADMIEADGDRVIHITKPSQPPPLDDEEKGEALLNAIERTSDSGVNSGFPYQINSDCTRFWPRT